MTKVGKSDGEVTFAGVRDNDEVAPIAAVQRTGIGTTRSDLKRYS